MRNRSLCFVALVVLLTAVHVAARSGETSDVGPTGGDTTTTTTGAVG